MYGKLLIFSAETTRNWEMSSCIAMQHSDWVGSSDEERPSVGAVGPNVANKLLDHSAVCHLAVGTCYIVEAVLCAASE